MNGNDGRYRGRRRRQRRRRGQASRRLLCRDQRRDRTTQHERRHAEPRLVREVFERGLQLERRCVAGVRVAVQRTRHDALERRRVRGHEARRRWQFVLDVLVRCVRREWQAADRQLVQEHPDGEHVAAAVDPGGVSRGLLRRYVGQLALARALAGLRTARQRGRNPEVDELHGAIAAHEDVCRRYVTVHDA